MKKDTNAIDKVRQMVADGQVSQEVAEKYLPELKGRDGGKIRERLIAFLSQCKAVYGDSFKQFELNIDEALAWLEKKGEQNLSNVERTTKNWKEPVSEDLEKIVEEIADSTILNAYGTKELARRLRNTICGTSVSEDLKEASKEWLIPQLDKSYANYGEAKMMELTHFDGYAMLDAIEFGAKWKEQQFEKNRVKHCNSITNEQAELEQGFIDQHLDKHQRMPTFLDAIEYGMRLQKEQMMTRALDGEVGYWNLRGLSVNVELPRSVNEGDRVKVIVTKEG